VAGLFACVCCLCLCLCVCLCVALCRSFNTCACLDVRVGVSGRRKAAGMRHDVGFSSTFVGGHFLTAGMQCTSVSQVVHRSAGATADEMTCGADLTF